MGIEIERKFLVTSDGWRALPRTSHRCHQGYINLKAEGSLRVRRLGEKGFLTLKGPRQGIRREEYEYEIPAEDATDMLRSFCQITLLKTRHEIEFEGFLWEIDEFHEHNQGLVLAEVELPAEDTEFVLPPWVGKDVSEDDRFFNARLALHPIATWTANPVG